MNKRTEIIHYNPTMANQLLSEEMKAKIDEMKIEIDTDYQLNDMQIYDVNHMNDKNLVTSDIVKVNLNHENIKTRTKNVFLDNSNMITPIQIRKIPLEYSPLPTNALKTRTNVNNNPSPVRIFKVISKDQKSLINTQKIENIQTLPQSSQAVHIKGTGKSIHIKVNSKTVPDNVRILRNIKNAESITVIKNLSTININSTNTCGKLSNNIETENILPINSNRNKVLNINNSQSNFKTELLNPSKTVQENFKTYIVKVNRNSVRVNDTEQFNVDIIKNTESRHNLTIVSPSYLETNSNTIIKTDNHYKLTENVKKTKNCNQNRNTRHGVKTIKNKNSFDRLFADKQTQGLRYLLKGIQHIRKSKLGRRLPPRKKDVFLQEMIQELDKYTNSAEIVLCKLKQEVEISCKLKQDMKE